jgi:hypothetical protein
MFFHIRNLSWLRYSHGDVTEMTFRTASENLFSLNADFQLLQEPERKRRPGAPDFIAFNTAAKAGCAETNDVDSSLYGSNGKSYFA